MLKSVDYSTTEDFSDFKIQPVELATGTIRLLQKIPGAAQVCVQIEFLKEEKKVWTNGRAASRVRVRVSFQGRKLLLTKGTASACRIC